MYLGSLEAGGTKMVCAIGTEKGEILDKKSIPTTTPEETMPLILDYFRKEKIEAIAQKIYGASKIEYLENTEEKIVA